MQFDTVLSSSLGIFWRVGMYLYIYIHTMSWGVHPWDDSRLKQILLTVAFRYEYVCGRMVLNITEIFVLNAWYRHLCFKIGAKSLLLYIDTWKRYKIYCFFFNLWTLLKVYNVHKITMFSIFNYIHAEHYNII